MQQGTSPPRRAARPVARSATAHASHFGRGVHQALLLVAMLCAGAAIVMAGPKDRGSVTINRADQHHAAYDPAIDQFIMEAAASDGLEPRPICDDATFLRRVTLDLIGRIPTYVEYRKFIHNDAPDKRAQLVNALLQDERFVDRWTTFYADMFQARSNEQGGRAFSKYLRDSLQDGLPYDVMVGRMLTAMGSYHQEKSAGFVVNTGGEPLEMAGIVAQTMLGVRMKCAQCHDHPYDIWTQKDYYKLAAYFGHTSVMNAGNNRNGTHVYETKDAMVHWPPDPYPGSPSKPMQPDWPVEFNIGFKDQIVGSMNWKNWQKQSSDPLADDMDSLMELADNSPGSSTAMKLDTERQSMTKGHKWKPESPDREALAQLITSRDNRYFAPNLVNRTWAALMGRGFVEPVDDFRPDNIASHPELLDHMASTFVEDNYSLRRLIERIVLSEAYQRQQAVGVDADQRKKLEHAFVAAALRPLPAETLYDSLITAGHLSEFKHGPGENMTTRTVRVRIEKPVEPKTDDPQMIDPRAAPPEEEVVSTEPFSPEAEVDFKKLFANDPLGGLRLLHAGKDDMSPEVMEEMAIEQGRVEIIYKDREQTYDDNPRFSSAYRMPAPAPQEHFLRQFGQPSRATLGEKRDESANMRQALMLMNGRLPNEAARVGRLEPVARLLRERVDHEVIVDRIYLETLTREPTDEESQLALALLEEYDDVKAAISDLRWAIFNSHEFRFQR